MAAVISAAGCRCAENLFCADEAKITRFFSWAAPQNEIQAQKFAQAGVTDIIVGNRKQHELAKKYGMNPYWKCFYPAGPHRQVISPEEEKLYDYLRGRDLDKNLSRAERKKILEERKVEKQYRYGGEKVTDIGILAYDLPCFISDEGLLFSGKKIDDILKDAPADSAGIFLDFIGYMNHKGCYCSACLDKLKTFLAAEKLPDTPENRNRFYRDALVKYYNDVIAYIKNKRPDFKIAVHIYPDFESEHLCGNRIKADFCGQTVAWYFKWDEEKIKQYTAVTVKKAKDHHAFAEGVPFLGLSSDKNSPLGYKTPEDVERELKAIINAGGTSLMVCFGLPIIEEGYFEVFKKFCGK